MESESAFVWLVVEETPSLLLALAGLVGAAAGFPQQRRAENADDAQVEDETEDQHPDGPQQGGQRYVGQERRPP